MLCPRCDGGTKVIDSREQSISKGRGNKPIPIVARTRKCLTCDYRFFSVEIPRIEYAKIIKEYEEDE